MTLASGVMIGLSACGGGTDEAPSPAPPRQVVVQPLELLKNQTYRLAYAGRVEAVTAAQLAFQVGGRLVSVDVREGQAVRRGDAIARLDDSDFQLQIREAAARERTLSADVQRKRALRAQGILAPAAVERATAELEAARVALATARRQAGYAVLKASYDGVVGQRLRNPGAVVAPGEPVVTLLDAGLVDVRVDLPEDAVAALGLGPELTAVGRPTAGSGAGTVQLQYYEHGSVPDPGNRTWPLVMRGSQPQDMTLLPGMAMHVMFESEDDGAQAGRYLVPATAVQSDAQGNMRVWHLDENDTVQPLDVDVIEVRGDGVVIGTDARPGTRVVVAGARMLTQGQQVDPQVRQ